MSLVITLEGDSGMLIRPSDFISFIGFILPRAPRAIHQGGFFSVLFGEDIVMSHTPGNDLHLLADGWLMPVAGDWKRPHDRRRYQWSSYSLTNSVDVASTSSACNSIPLS